ncbi:MAG TPA: MinD/ParA family protein [Candidatus Dormibacteraeota bacterium]|nr:MinD/ParA family protein [Candidatus Dormibacteraeota bacterium]
MAELEEERPLPSPPDGGPIPVDRPPAGSGGSEGREAAAPEPGDLGHLLSRRAARPRSGWWDLLARAREGLADPGFSRSGVRRRRLLAMARTPVRGGAVTVAVASGKGGVGKTTVAAGLASQLGLLRGDRVITLDANPDSPTLGLRVGGASRPTVADLSRELEAGRVQRQADLRAFTSQAPESRLEVLAGPLDPKTTEALGEADYARVLDALRRFYDVVVADLGTGLLDPANKLLLLRACDQVVVVTQASLDGARIADFTLSWLGRQRGPRWLRERSVLVVNAVRPGGPVDLDRMIAHFRPRVRAVCRVRWDAHLAAGGTFAWRELSRATREDYLELAAIVAAGFARSSTRGVER